MLYYRYTVVKTIFWGDLTFVTEGSGTQDLNST